MSRFLQESIPAWRIVFWGIVAGGVVAWFGTDHSWQHVALALLFGGISIGGFGFFLKWAITSEWIRAHVHWLIAFGVLGNLILLIWKLLELK